MQKCATRTVIGNLIKSPSAPAIQFLRRGWLDRAKNVRKRADSDGAMVVRFLESQSLSTGQAEAGTQCPRAGQLHDPGAACTILTCGV